MKPAIQAGAFTPSDVELLEQVAAQVAIALENARAYREIVELTDKLASEKLYLDQEIHSEHDFEEIMGDSQALKRPCPRRFPTRPEARQTATLLRS
ncbi:MAG TPA: hypothetical protein VGZ28_06075 [Terriglobales bacterium]|nr:hypothetical protein [Terriglobales bacterium]